MIDTKPRGRSDLLCQPLDDEAMLYNPADNSIHILNATAYTVWQHCDGEHGLAALEWELRMSYRVPEQHSVRADIRRLLGELLAQGLLA